MPVLCDGIVPSNTLNHPDVLLRYRWDNASSPEEISSEWIVFCRSLLVTINEFPEKKLGIASDLPGEWVVIFLLDHSEGFQM
jgi:hypothetical protein